MTMRPPSREAPAGFRWAWTVGAPFGVHVRVHVTFLLLLAWLVVSSAMQGEDAHAIWRKVAMIVALFGIVVLHELGHVLAARRYGITTRDITLLPFGGVAAMERLPADPRQELVVAIAGPAVNGVLAVVLALLGWALGESLTAASLLEQPTWLASLVWSNIVLGVFNLIPAFPMDGGRVLRALLAMRWGHDRATQIAAAVGQTLALVFGFIGLLTNPMLVLVAVFVWFGAAGEARTVHVRAAIAGFRVRDVMAMPVVTLPSDASLGLAVEASTHGFQAEFPVVEAGRVVGWIGPQELVGGLYRGGLDDTIASVMRPGACVVSPDLPLDDALTQLQRAEDRAAAVIANGRVVGVLTLAHLGEFVALEDARSERTRRLAFFRDHGI